MENIKTQVKCKAFKEFDRKSIAITVENFLNNLQTDEMLSAKVDFETFANNDRYVHFAYIIYTVKILTENN